MIFFVRLIALCKAEGVVSFLLLNDVLSHDVNVLTKYQALVWETSGVASTVVSNKLT